MSAKKQKDEALSAGKDAEHTTPSVATVRPQEDDENAVLEHDGKKAS